MRKMTSFLTGWLIPLFFILLIQECMAGVFIEEVHKDREGKMTKVFRYFSEGQFRTDHPESGLTTIIDFRGDRMVMIDHRSKSYVETQFSRWEKEVAERLKKSMPQIKPPERKIIVRGTGEKAFINGFQTEKIQIFAGSELIEENWMTRDVDIREVEKVMERVAKGFSKDFRLEMKEGREIYEKLKPYGIPILIKDFTLTYGLGAIDVLEVKKIEKKGMGEEGFLPPADYQRIIPEAPKK